MNSLSKKVTSAWLLVLFFLVVLSGCGGSSSGGGSGSTQPPTTGAVTHPYYKTTVGNGSTYNDGRSETITANSNNKLTVDQLNSDGKTQLTVAVSGTALAIESAKTFNTAGVLTGTTTYSPAFKVFPSSTTVGTVETQTITITPSTGTASSRSCTLTVLPAETVTVAAGTYQNALKVQNSCTDSYSWFAQGVGEIKEQDITSGEIIDLIAQVSGTQTTPVATLATNVVTVTSTIATPTTWLAGKVYVVGTLSVDSALTIQPGTVVKFTAGGSITVSASGVITASGTSTVPIIFTSIKDDSRGGITNGNVLAPAAGAWRQITLNSSGSTFDHCEFYYAGGDTAHKATIEIGGNLTNSATITSSVFAHNDGGGITDSSAPKGIVKADFASAATIISNNTFYDNNVPLTISGLFSVDKTNTFHDPYHPTTINKYNGIYLIGHSSKPITGTITFAESEVPFVLAGYITVPVGSALTIGDGVIFKFFSASDELQISGTITANASVGKKIVFTSLKDDAHGGDTNGDGTASSPAKNDWARITLLANGSSFNRCEFYYGGNSVNKSVLKFGGAYSATIANSTFAHNDGGGVSDSSAPYGALDADIAAAGTVITGNTFYDNNVPLKISGLFSVDDSNTFHDPAHPATTNTYNGIFLIGHSAKEITGLITFAETEVPYVLAGYVTVPASSVLTLQDDVVIKFFSGPDYLTVYGVLKADASVGHKIVFTSMKDDAHGGDTNGDGSATVPAAKDWDQILLDASGSSFTRSEFYYGGHTVATSVLKFGGGSPLYSATITNSIFAHNDGGNVSDIVWYAFGALDAQNAAYGTVIANNVFFDNNIPLKISGKFSLDDSNIFHDPSNTTVKNKYNGICFAGNSYNDFFGQITLLETEVPFVIQGDIAVPSGSTLTLGNGVIFKFAGSGTQFRIDGTVTEGAGVFYTSLKDDAYLGDTNGDGAASSPASGDWYGIRRPTSTWIHPLNMFYNKY